MRIMVAKTGGSVACDERSRAKASPVGDTTGGVMGLIRGLLDLGHDVCLFGARRGALPAGAWGVAPKNKDLDELSTVKEVTRVYDAAVEELQAFGPEVCLNVGGPAASCSWIGNPRGVGLQTWAIKYTGPALYAIQKLKLPRIVVIHDPRNYPIEHEMLHWEHCVPQAVLSLEEADFTFRSLHRRWRVKTVRSLGENWWSYGLPYENGPTHSLLLPVARDLLLAVAHGHFKDPRLRKGREAVWRNLLEKYRGPLLDIAGKDWDAAAGWLPGSVRWLGVVKPGKVRELLLRTSCGPIVPIADKFVTSKIRQYALYGALPLLHGRGEFLTHDYEYRYVPQDAEIRVSNAAELKEATWRADSDEPWRRAWVDKIRKATGPDFSVVEHCMEHYDDYPSYS